jgi:hypothetical protein
MKQGAFEKKRESENGAHKKSQAVEFETQYVARSAISDSEGI